MSRLTEAGKRLLDKQLIRPLNKVIPLSLIPSSGLSLSRLYQYIFDVVTTDPDTGERETRTVSVVSDRRMSPLEAQEELEKLYFSKYGNEAENVDEVSFRGQTKRRSSPI